MGIQERKSRERELARENILKAAKELFATGGYENVSMRKIAERINYSTTKIYTTFKNKDDVLKALIRESYELLDRRFQEVKNLRLPPLKPSSV